MSASPLAAAARISRTMGAASGLISVVKLNCPGSWIRTFSSDSREQFIPAGPLPYPQLCGMLLVSNKVRSRPDQLPIPQITVKERPCPRPP